ncbi:MAG: hypothetical protein WC960_02600 [Bacteroidales bacterium]
MKKLFALIALSGFIVASCGSNTPKEEPKEETTVVEKTETTTEEVTDSTATTETPAKEEATSN